jgi:hypothetical protein
MISIERIKELLKNTNLKLNNDEIKQLRDYLYVLAEIQIMAEEKLAEE